MGRLNVEKENRIYELYKENLSYKKTAIEEDVDVRTVRRIVREKTKHANNKGMGTKDQGSGRSALPEEKMKMLYREFNQGSDPTKIIERYGIDSDFVMKEHKRYHQFKQQDIAFASFQGYLLHYFMARNYSELRPFEEIYKKKGILSLEDTTVLFRLAILRILYDFGIPSGWKKITCKVCGGLITIADPTDQIGIRIINEFQNPVHEKCLGSGREIRATSF